MPNLLDLAAVRHRQKYQYCEGEMLMDGVRDISTMAEGPLTLKLPRPPIEVEAKLRGPKGQGRESRHTI